MTLNSTIFKRNKRQHIHLSTGKVITVLFTTLGAADNALHIAATNTSSKATARWIILTVEYAFMLIHILKTHTYMLIKSVTNIIRLHLSQRAIPISSI